MRRGLALGGGGAKGCAQARVIKELYAAGNRYDFITGVSVGSANGLATLVSLLKKNWGYLKNTWYQIEDKSFVFQSPVKNKLGLALSVIPGLSRMVSTKSIYTTDPLQRLTSDIWEKHGRSILAHPELPYLMVGVVDLLDGQYKIIPQTSPSFDKYILASMSIPIVFEPVIHDTKFMVDGGLTTVNPLNALIDAGCNEIDVILCSPMSQTITSISRLKNTKDIAVRCLDILLHNNFVRDIKNIVQLNDHPKYKSIKVRVFAPNSQYMDTMDFSLEKIQLGWNQHYKQVLHNPVTLTNVWPDSWR